MKPEVAAELSGLRATLAHATDPDLRAALRARIAALTAQGLACAPASPPVAATATSGLLAREAGREAPQQRRPADPERGWHEVGTLSAADVLGLKP
jgi:hypothetical protein